MNCLSNLKFLSYYNDNQLNNKLSVVDDVIEDIVSSKEIIKNKKIKTKLINKQIIKTQLPILLESNILNNKVNKELSTSTEQNNSISVEKSLENSKINNEISTSISNQLKFIDNGTSPIKSLSSKTPSSSSLENLVSSINNNITDISISLDNKDNKDNISINNNNISKVNLIDDDDNIYDFNKFETECNYDWEKDVEMNQLKHISNLSNWRLSIMEKTIQPIEKCSILENDNNIDNNDVNNNIDNDDDIKNKDINQDGDKLDQNNSNNNIQNDEYNDDFEVDVLDDYSLLNININKEKIIDHELRDSLSLNDIINKKNDEYLNLISSDVNNKSTSVEDESDDISLKSILNQFNIVRNANKRIATNTSNSLDEIEFEELNHSILSNKLKSKINSGNKEINNSIISKTSKNIQMNNKPMKKNLTHKEIYQKDQFEKSQYYHKQELLRIKSKQVKSNKNNNKSPQKKKTNFIKKNLNVFKNSINNSINNGNTSKLIINQNEKLKEINNNYSKDNNKEPKLVNNTKINISNIQNKNNPIKEKSSFEQAFQSSNINIQQQITSLLSKSLVSNKVQSYIEQCNKSISHGINKQVKSKNNINSPPRTKVNKTRNQLISAKNIIESFTSTILIKNNNNLSSTPSQSLIFEDNLPIPPPPPYSLLQKDNKLINNQNKSNSINDNNDNTNDNDYYNNLPIPDKKTNLITFSF
jgi:hypothetical protein